MRLSLSRESARPGRERDAKNSPTRAQVGVGWEMWGSHPPRFRCPNRLSHILDLGCQPFDFSEDYPTPYGCLLVPTSALLPLQGREGSICRKHPQFNGHFLATPIDLGFWRIIRDLNPYLSVDDRLSLPLDELSV